MEYIILTGLLLAVLTPVLYTSLSTLHDHFKTSKVEDLVNVLTDKANDLYKLGPGNKDSLRLIIPAGITGASITGNSILISTSLRGENATIGKEAEPHLIGSLDTIQGEYVVPVKVLNHTLVRIGSGPWIVAIDPSCIGAPNFANPPNVTIHGDDFSSSSVLYKDDTPFDPAFYSVVDAGTLVFIAHPTEFFAQPGGAPFRIRIEDNGKSSNEAIFLVYPTPQQCP